MSLQELIASGLVLESPEHGPQLCLGWVGMSNPPVGAGPDITNWDWSKVSDHETVEGTRWGNYTVVGTLEDGAFTTTRPPIPWDPRADHTDDSGGDEVDPFATPCPPPSGGWRVEDPELTTPESLTRARRVAEALPGFAWLWVDQSINPAIHRSRDDDEFPMNDPRKLILNVAVTGDVAQVEATLREVWGGALCVSSAVRTEAELLDIRAQVQETLDQRAGVDWLTSGVRQDHIDIGVVYDDGSLQRELEERYPGGVVVISSALAPYRPAAEGP